MFDIREIRDDPEAFDAGLAKRGLASQSARLLAMDEARRRHVAAHQAAQERRNALSKEIGQAKAAKDEPRAATLMAEVAQLKTFLQDGEEEGRRLDADLQTALSEIPNLPADDVPVGPDEHANVERHRHGAPQVFPFPARQHFELGEASGLMDFETAAKLSGARFVVLKGAMARLERALAQFMLDTHTAEFGYTEVSPPLLVRDEAMFGTAQLPKFFPDQFAAFPASVLEHDEANGAGYEFSRKLGDPTRYWLIPTAEVPLTNMVRGSILTEDELPLRLTAWTPCFRAEAGAAGRDTRGMIRQHQFSKVELVSVTTPENSADEHERMLGCAEEILKRLGLAYRVMLLSSGDMGFAARKTYDIEVWLPGQDAYREISSCSVCGDFQARRMAARYRPREGKGPRHVHTLNGSALAVGRTMVALLETYQDEGGGVSIPDALAPYMGGVTRIDATVR